MSPQDFLAHFHEIANAPGGVARLRELIRTLAIQGVLVTQQSSDGDARKFLSDLLEHKFASESNQRKRLTSVDEITAKLGESPGLPMNWVRVLFGDIMINRDGERVPVSKAERETRLGQYDYYGASGVIDKIDSFLFDKPLLLIGEDGANLLNRSTPIAFMARGKYWVNNHAHVLDGYNEDFLRYIELHINAITLEAYVTGTAQPKMNQAKMNSIPIALPPLAEQKRIVAKVEELMALCDALEAQQQERARLLPRLSRATHTRLTDSPTQPHLDSLFADLASISPEDMRRTIINFAVQGWLVKQDTNDEPASEALQRIRQARLNAGEKDFGTVPDDDVPFELPSEWRWIKMGNLALSSDSGWSPQCESIPRNGTEWGVLKVSAVSWDTFDPEENKALPVGMAPRPECEVRDGDFLLSRANTEELVARSVVVTSTPPHLMMSDKIVRFVFPEEVEKQFINLANSTTFARAHYAKHASGTSSSMKNVGRGTMCNLPIPFPPLAEQRRIVAKVEELMALVDTLEAQQQEKSRLAEAFAQTCVASFTNA
jgi:type I restriction enzyme S subunit